MLGRRFVTMGALVLVAGCGMIAGVRDLEYGEPLPATETSPTDPLAPEAGTTSSGGEAIDGSRPDPLATDAATDAEVDAADEPEQDAGAGALPGCTTADFLANDLRGPNKVRLIAFPVAAPPAQYAPRCLMIRVGQSVTWQGNLVVDPLAPRSQNPPSPITLTAAGNTATFTFTQKGRYRYGSTANVAMRGAIEVRP